MGLTDGTPRGAGAWPRRGCGPRDETTRRGHSLPPWDARASMPVVEEPEAEARPEAGHRGEPRQGLGVMGRGGGDEGACAGTPQRSVGGDERTSDGQTFLSRWSGTALGDAVTVGFVGDLWAHGGQGRRAVGMVDGGEACAAWACQGPASAQQVAGGAPRGGGDRGVGEPPAAPQPGDWVGVARVVCGFAPMEGLHGEGMTTPTRATGVSTEVCTPVPGTQACGREDNLLAGGRAGREPRLRGGGHGTGQPRFPGLVEDAQVHGAGVEIETTRNRVRLGGEAP